MDLAALLYGQMRMIYGSLLAQVSQAMPAFSNGSK